MSGISNIILGSCATVTKFSWLIELPVAIGKTCIPKKKKSNEETQATIIKRNTFYSDRQVK